MSRLLRWQRPLRAKTELTVALSPRDRTHVAKSAPRFLTYRAGHPGAGEKEAIPSFRGWGIICNRIHHAQRGEGFWNLKTQKYKRKETRGKVSRRLRRNAKGN